MENIYITEKNIFNIFVILTIYIFDKSYYILKKGKTMKNELRNTNELLHVMYEKLSSDAHNSKILFINFYKPFVQHALNIKNGTFLYVAYSAKDKENVEMNENRYNENVDAVIMGDELEEWMKNRKFDYCIMNPPYCKTLHLRVLETVSKHVEKEIVNLSPIVNYVTRKNVFSDIHIKKFNEQPLKDYCVSVEQLSLDSMVRLFHAKVTNTGIQHYVLNEKHDITPTTYVSGDVELIRKIMTVAMKDSVKLHPNGKYILNISLVHGNLEEDSKDKFFFMNLTWDTQLATKGKTTIGFDSETDAHDFYDFWMSKYGIQLTKLWKCDIRTYTHFIPYFWAKKGDEKDAIMKHFNLTEQEFETLMNM